MRILYSSSILASSSLAGGRIGPQGLAFNGQPIIDEAQFFRAENATVFGRGDGPVELSFSVLALFASEAERLLFEGTHREALPLQADLTLTDDDEAVELLMEDAVRSVSFGAVRGASVLVNYRFVGAKFTSEDVTTPPTDTDTVKAGNESLSASNTSKAVVFDVPFATKPRFVGATIAIPGGGTVTAVSVDESYDEEGFTARFASIPASGYVLRWCALL